MAPPAPGGPLWKLHGWTERPRDPVSAQAPRVLALTKSAEDAVRPVALSIRDLCGSAREKRDTRLDFYRDHNFLEGR
ncbi:hypothetical protein GCM10012286_80310 [Streptomyces lasiicapitis]|uniref:Uncharacterized protein n=1 Tax=Streptomyces lasiicapitis TaxID=1923961 RepID=A0ABQ2MW58_9ACTN|nr:hypothetical protein GCM10012286_80310 [Streptomyces lasiicapitis]